MDQDVDEEVLKRLVAEIRQIQLENGGTLRHGPEQKGFMQRVMAFQEAHHYTHERCAEVLGLKPHVVGYLHTRYRQLFKNPAGRDSGQAAIFKPVEIKNHSGDRSGHFVFDLGQGMTCKVSHVEDALQLIEGLKNRA